MTDIVFILLQIFGPFLGVMFAWAVLAVGYWVADWRKWRNFEPIVPELWSLHVLREKYEDLFDKERTP